MQHPRSVLFTKKWKRGEQVSPRAFGGGASEDPFPLPIQHLNAPIRADDGDGAAERIEHGRGTDARFPLGTRVRERRHRLRCRVRLAHSGAISWIS